MVRPYVEKYRVTFPVAVDSADLFGELFGLKAIPVTFFIDEVGIVRLQGGGPGESLLRKIEAILKEPVASIRAKRAAVPSSQTVSALEARVAANPKDWRARLALAQVYDANGRFGEALAQCQAAAELHSSEANVLFTWGLILLHDGRREAAVGKLREARDLAPDNWRIRKQIWALEHPDKFYTGHSPDFGWQKEQLAREKAAGTDR